MGAATVRVARREHFRRATHPKSLCFRSLMGAAAPLTLSKALVSLSPNCFLASTLMKSWLAPFDAAANS